MDQYNATFMISENFGLSLVIPMQSAVFGVQGGLAWPDPSPQHCVGAEECSGCIHYCSAIEETTLCFFKPVITVLGGAKPRIQ